MAQRRPTDTIGAERLTGTEHLVKRQGTPTLASPVHNRIGRLMEHIPWYSICGQARLARDAGVSRAALSRLLSRQASPSFATVMSITKALERRLGRPLDPRELVSLDGSYPTASVCTLAGCRGCGSQKQYEREQRAATE